MSQWAAGPFGRLAARARVGIHDFDLMGGPVLGPPAGGESRAPGTFVAQRLASSHSFATVFQFLVVLSMPSRRSRKVPVYLVSA